MNDAAGLLHNLGYCAILPDTNLLNMKTRMLVAVSLCLAIAARAQTDSLLHDPLPTTKEEFKASEPMVINTVNYLETTPIDKQGDGWKVQAGLLTRWLTNAPEVTVDINEKTCQFIKKNQELMFVFMGGWTRYVLQNGYSKDAIQGNVAGIRSAIKVYKAGNGLRKDKEMEKLIKLDESGGLESWVVTQLGGQKG
jgi:hypothetical protein